MMLQFCGIVSVLFFLACEFMPEQLMRIFAEDAGLISIGSAYLRIAGWSYLLRGYIPVLSYDDEGVRTYQTGGAY